MQVKQFTSAVYLHLCAIKIQRCYRRARVVAVAKARLDAVVLLQVSQELFILNVNKQIKHQSKLLLSNQIKFADKTNSATVIAAALYCKTFGFVFRREDQSQPKKLTGVFVCIKQH